MAPIKLLPLMIEVANMLIGAPKQVVEVKEELEIIKAFVYGAVEQHNRTHEIKSRVMELRDAAFCLEDEIEEYMISEEQQPQDPGCAALLCDTANFFKTLVLRLRIASQIQDIKSRVIEINKRSETSGFQIRSSSFEQGSSSFTGRSRAVTRHGLRQSWTDGDERSEEAEEVVGFDAQKYELICSLVEGRAVRTVISVVGMGGMGKTTLAKTVFTNEKVIRHFDCHVWITVSQSYTAQDLFKNMLKKLYQGKREAPPEGISEMGRESLITEVRNYLQEKRYVIVFDDVWDNNFWREIKFAVLDNKKGSRILITTRNVEVAEFCKESSFVHIHNLQPLSQHNSWDLLCKKAFQNEPEGHCPKELEDISYKILEKCNGLPLAIIAIGGLLASKETSEWQSLCQTLISEQEKNLNSTGITNILSLSYDALPDYLQSCFLYFGIYPEDYKVESTRLIMQWIAEGFVKSESEETTVEEVAEQYLEELIDRSLVQVSSFSIDGKARRCCVHDLFHEMILEKIEDLSFCQFIKDDQPVLSRMIRRIKVATNSNNLMDNIEGSHIRSLYISREEELPKDVLRKIPTKYKLLKVLDFEHAPLNYVPENLGSLFHLRYLSFRKTNVKSLPNSIGNLHFLETLDLRQTHLRQMPSEINKLIKLRHLLANHTIWGFNHGLQMMEGIGGLESLQSLRQVETDHGGVELIKELEKLKQLRLLGLILVKKEYGSDLCSSINKMRHLEKLYIDAIDFNEVIDLHNISSLPVLQKLRLRGKLEWLPVWIPKLQNLVKLSLISSNLIVDPLKSLQHLPSLLSLSLHSAYEGESLHFQDGGFKTLKRLSLKHLYSLNCIIVGEGALPLLKEFMLEYIPQLIEVPTGINHLGNLEVFHIINMPYDFWGGIVDEHWIKKHVRHVNIANSFPEDYWAKKTRLM